MTATLTTFQNTTLTARWREAQTARHESANAAFCVTLRAAAFENAAPSRTPGQRVQKTPCSNFKASGSFMFPTLLAYLRPTKAHLSAEPRQNWRGANCSQFSPKESRPGLSTHEARWFLTKLTRRCWHDIHFITILQINLSGTSKRRLVTTQTNYAKGKHSTFDGTSQNPRRLFVFSTNGPSW